MQNDGDFRRRWTRSESRQVRPFRDIKDYLNATALRLHDDDEFSIDETIQEGQVDGSRLKPAIRISAQQIDLSEHVGISEDSLEFAIVVEDGLFKTSEVVFRSQLDGVHDRCIEFPPEQCRQIATWGPDTRIHVAVILSEDLATAPGTAYRAGSWLAKKTFRITREVSLARFPIDPVDKDWFLGQRLPADTTYLIKVISTDFDDPALGLEDLVRVKVNRPLVEALARDEKSLTSKAIIHTIYTDIVTSIISIGFSSEREEPHPDGVLYAAITRIAQQTGIPSERLVNWAKSGEGTELRAVIQAQVGLTRALVSAARRRPV